MVADIVARYAVDGVHLDYLRYPNDDFDYSREAPSRRSGPTSSRAWLDRPIAAAASARLGGDLVAWTEAFPERWTEFRRDIA